MSHANDRDDDHRIVDFVEHPVVAVPESVAVLARQLLRPLWTWVACERLNLRDQLLPVLAGNAFKFLSRGPLDYDAIACHAALDP